MAEAEAAPAKGLRHGHRPRWLHSGIVKSRAWSAATWTNLRSNNLWRRVVKYSIATTLTIIIVLIPEVVALFPGTTFLAPLTTVFANPGQRMGAMVEGLLLTLVGATMGTAWGSLGLWLSSRAVDDNLQAAFAIRALFLLCAVFHHGYLRSSSPRLIVYVLFHLTSSTIILMGPWRALTNTIVTYVAYPILIGMVVTFLINFSIFPEPSNDFLAHATIDAIDQTTLAVTRSTNWFLSPGDGPDEPKSDQPAEALPNTAGTAKTEVGSSAKRPWYHHLWSGLRNPLSTPGSRAPVISAPAQHINLAALTASKAALRSGLQRCRAGQSEVNLEIAIGPLPPSSLKPITTKAMPGLVHNAVMLIGACENKFVLLGDGEPDDATDTEDEDPFVRPLQRASALEELLGPRKFRNPTTLAEEDPLDALESVKPLRELEAGDPEVLEAIIKRIQLPTKDFTEALRQAALTVTTSLAYCYGLPKLKTGMPTPKRIILEEMDIHIDAFMDAIAIYDFCSTEELERATTTKNGETDIMPRMETFLVSSFLLGLRQSAVHMLQLLRYARLLVEKRHRRHRMSIHFPEYFGWRQWLATGGERDAMVLPQTMRKKGRSGRIPTPKEESRMEEEGTVEELDRPLARQRADVESVPNVLEASFQHAKPPFPTPPKAKGEAKKKKKEKRRAAASGGIVSRNRARVADVYESLQRSDDAIYAVKLAIAFFIISWPGFIPSWHEWYATIRGVWAPLQLILIFEVVIGTSFFVFILRLVGVTFGCVMGYAACVAGGSHRAPLVVILVIGAVPSVYIQLGTKYVKTGMVAISSMTAVALTTVNENTVSHVNLYTRLVTFFIGCSVGLLVELILYPARARDRMVESLSTSIKQMSSMQTAIAVGVDNPKNLQLRSDKVQQRFERSREKAQGALSAAETFLPFCLTEPRLKGSFRQLHPIYREIIYVLHQIVDRMDNMLQLRRVYGSSVLEELNAEVHAYRRAVAASIAIALFVVNQALTTRMPLPQFIPSARLAMLRLINRVRQALIDKAAQHSEMATAAGGARKGGMRNYMASMQGPERVLSEDERTARVVTQHKFLSWNANAAGLMEIIEYLEELVELAKLLVGVNAFRSGMLEKPTFKEYAKNVKTREVPVDEDDAAAGASLTKTESRRSGTRIKRPGTGLSGLARQDTGQAKAEVGQRPDTGLSRPDTARPDTGSQRHDHGLQRHDTASSTGRQAAAERGDTGLHLHRTWTRGSRARSDSLETAVEGEAEIPLSLRRVSSRRASARKRRPTVTGAGTWRRDDDKGKGIEEEDER
ncbi:putative membrane protein like [Verticillium longisporum]|uniref:Putative membrane protein like n=1 Tax=Verticillium longisporum TaxID=100787 RepID=A0A8I2Z9Q9_VERLO|nr:putative membrane protein like [Verticillium longisporum]